jgi:hypothetical protein
MKSPALGLITIEWRGGGEALTRLRAETTLRN